MFTFSLGDLEQGDHQTANASAAREYPYRGWEDVYREKWRWDKVGTVTHCVDCYPGFCPTRAYVKDGRVLFSEQRAGFDVVEQGVPDMNPMGCQKGVNWQEVLYGRERVLYPLRRLGERGEGRWKRISWEEALDEIADALLDAVQEQGPQSVFSLTGGSPGGASLMGWLGVGGSISTDNNAEVHDFSPGFYLTWGLFDPVSSHDDWFHAELTILWHANYAYTRIPYFHYALEARYKGSDVVVIAPDFSPSCVHADYHVPVRIGTDAALCLAMCKVIIDEGLMHTDFVKEQTDLPLLVRLDDRRFLRGSDVAEDGRSDQFYFYDTRTRAVVEAPRGSLTLGEIDPALEGSYRVTLKDGSTVEVAPVFALVKERLNDYTPERASAICGVHPDVIRMLARKVATRRTNMLTGEAGAGRYYHGDLMDRALLLMLALTSNWGRKGTGVRCWTVVGLAFASATQRPGRAAAVEAQQRMRMGMEFAKSSDPTMTDEIASIELQKFAMSQGMGGIVPPVFIWYHHGGYRERWNRRDYHDPSMSRPFDDYFQEAMAKGWWQGVALPTADMQPRVLILDGSNPIRRTPGGQSTLLRHLWPKLRMVVALEPRMSATAHFADIVLPVKASYEKMGFCIPTTHIPGAVFCDRVADPPGENKSEWEITGLILQVLERKAKERGLTEYKDAWGNTHRFEGRYDTFIAGGERDTEEKLFAQRVEATVVAGAFPEGTTLQTLQEKGYIRWQSLGPAARALGQATDIKPDETFVPFRKHVEEKQPYPTLTRRAQFYIDHEWFLEAGEELPMHKEPPQIGGDYPFIMTGGHNRWSIHALHMANRNMLNTHRGRPHMVMNSDDAARKGIQDDEEVRVYNDHGSITIPVKLSPSVRPGQVIIYNGWEPYMFRGQHGPNDIETGMVKWLHLAGGYGHLKYWPMEWQPMLTMRGDRVDVAKID